MSILTQARQKPTGLPVLYLASGDRKRKEGISHKCQILKSNSNVNVVDFKQCCCSTSNVFALLNFGTHTECNVVLSKFGVCFISGLYVLAYTFILGKGPETNDNSPITRNATTFCEPTRMSTINKSMVLKIPLITECVLVILI